MHVSEFITMLGLVKKVDGSPARVVIGPIGNKSCWNNEQFLKQVDDAVRRLQKYYPDFRLDYKFDNAPIHHNKSKDTQILEKMNKNPGGKQV